MEEIRLGTVGSGFIVRFILNAVRVTPHIALELVYSRSPEKAAALAAEYGCRRTETDWRRFLSDDRVNTVYIATPNALHYDMARAALSAGKHVILEKPFTTTAAQARSLKELAEERDLLLVEAAPTTYLPHFRVLRRQLEALGPIRLVTSNYSQYSARYDILKAGELPAIFDPAMGGGALMDLNFYNALLNVALFGPPQRVSYRCNAWGDCPDTSGVLLMEYPGFLSVNAAGKDCRGVSFFQIQGERGSLYIENGSNGLSALRLSTEEGERRWEEQGAGDRWYYEIRELTRLMLQEPEALKKRLRITLDTAAVLEEARKKAGIWFPGDEG